MPEMIECRECGEEFLEDKNKPGYRNVCWKCTFNPKKPEVHEKVEKVRATSDLDESGNFDLIRESVKQQEWGFMQGATTGRIGHTVRLLSGLAAGKYDASKVRRHRNGSHAA